MSDVKPEFRNDTAYCSEKCPSCILHSPKHIIFRCIAGRLRCGIFPQLSMCAPWYKAKLEAVEKEKNELTQSGRLGAMTVMLLGAELAKYVEGDSVQVISQAFKGAEEELLKLDAEGGD